MVTENAKVLQFKAAFKVAAKKKVASAGKKELQDQRLLTQAQSVGLEKLKGDEEKNEKRRAELLEEIKTHKADGDLDWMYLKQFDLEGVENALKMLKMLEHSNKQWAEIEKDWKDKLSKTVPEARRGEVSSLTEEGNRVFEEKKDLKEMRRITKALSVILELSDTDDNYMKVFVDNKRNWFEVKKKFVAGAISQPKMKELWNYRQKVTDKMLADMKNEFKFAHAAVGSTDLTSDIDVGVVSHGEDAEGKIFFDWQIVNTFNDRFKARFKQEPGVFFDVNLYASAPKARVAGDLDDDNPAKKSMQAMTNAGQDVGALMKQRRYMSYEEYEKYEKAIIGPYEKQLVSTEDAERRKEIQSLIDITAKQFSEADSLYQISLRRSLDKASAVLNAKMQELVKTPSYSRTPEQQQAFGEAEKKLLKLQGLFSGISNEKDLAEGQKKLIEAVEWIEHDLDLSMAVNNQIYTEAIEEVRRLETEIFNLQQAEAELVEQVQAITGNPEKTIDDAMQLNVLQMQLEQMQKDNKAAGLTARISDLYADAVLFANEAYLSEGPMKHIVDAAQGAKFHLEAGLVDDVSAFDWDMMSEDERKLKLKAVQEQRRASLSTHECLQSFNEQFGDMLKDLNHYKTEPPGFAFYRASKYLSRLLDAIDLLAGKLTTIDWATVLRDGGLTKPASALASGVNAQILPIRGGKGDNLIQNPDQYKVEESDSKEAAAEKVRLKEEALQAHVRQQMSQLFNVSDVGGLKTLMNGLSQQINIACREQIAKEMKASDDSAYFKSVGKGDKDPSGGKVR